LTDAMGDAEEIVQDTFVKIWENGHHFRKIYWEAVRKLCKWIWKNKFGMPILLGITNKRKTLYYSFASPSLHLYLSYVRMLYVWRQPLPE